MVHDFKKESKGIPVRFTAKEQIQGNFDPTRIRQLMVNLLSNALKYGNSKPIDVSLRTNETHAVFTVKDQGMGIAPEHQERIFKQFERAVPARYISGLGLGLFIAKKIAENHNGFITVKSALDAGSEFSFHLPLQ